MQALQTRHSNSDSAIGDDMVSNYIDQNLQLVPIDEVDEEDGGFNEAHSESIKTDSAYNDNQEEFIKKNHKVVSNENIEVHDIDDDHSDKSSSSSSKSSS
jgi:hypothetical protein